MGFKSSHTQQKVLPKIDLTRLKEMTEDDWKQIVNTVPFTNNPMQSFVDYTDNSNLGRTNFIFKQRVFKTAKESGLSMLRTLNFIQ